MSSDITKSVYRLSVIRYYQVCLPIKCHPILPSLSTDYVSYLITKSVYRLSVILFSTKVRVHRLSHTFYHQSQSPPIKSYFLSPKSESPNPSGPRKLQVLRNSQFTQQ